VDELPFDVLVEEVGVVVGVVEVPSVGVDPLPSEGAGLTPPALGTVEMPPVARTLIFTGAVVAIDVEVDVESGPPGLVDVVLEPGLPGRWEEAGVGAISAGGDTAGAESPTSASALGVIALTRAGERDGAGATIAARA
jgi:hypothetical protein